MLGNLNGWHLVILLVLILLLFGAAKLPGLARSVGQSARIFKGELKAMKATDAAQHAAEADAPATADGTASAVPELTANQPWRR